MSTIVAAQKFLTGNQDSLKREKRFCNITKFRVNVAMRATDIDTKDITVSRKAPFLELFLSPAVLGNRPRNESVRVIVFPQEVRPHRHLVRNEKTAPLLGLRRLP